MNVLKSDGDKCLCISHCGISTEDIKELVQDISGDLKNFTIVHISPQAGKIDCFKFAGTAGTKEELMRFAEQAKIDTNEEQFKPYWAVQATMEKFKQLLGQYNICVLLSSSHVATMANKAGILESFTAKDTIIYPTFESIRTKILSLLQNVETM